MAEPKRQPPRGGSRPFRGNASPGGPRPRRPYSGGPNRPHASGPSGPARDRSRDGTSWEKSADWYDRIIGENGSELYQQVVVPGALELLGPKRDEVILDLGCGQGVFSRAMAQRGARVTGLDASASLIHRARAYPAPGLTYVVRDAAQLDGLDPMDAISAILCLQNLQHLDAVCAAACRALKSGGRMLWVLNHPAFRIPRQSSWGFEAERKIQYRRMDAYSSSLQIPILMHPGRADSESTLSVHRSLEELMQPAFAAGLQLAGLREWHSHKESQPGPRARAENRARREFPLFLALLWRKP
jgi:ubiquinone/menaquinone biosynthesis C-methylase UbiE